MHLHTFTKMFPAGGTLVYIPLPTINTTVNTHRVHFLQRVAFTERFMSLSHHGHKACLEPYSERPPWEQQGHQRPAGSTAAGCEYHISELRTTEYVVKYYIWWSDAQYVKYLWPNSGCRLASKDGGDDSGQQASCIDRQVENGEECASLLFLADMTNSTSYFLLKRVFIAVNSNMDNPVWRIGVGGNLTRQSSSWNIKSSASPLRHFRNSLANVDHHQVNILMFKFKIFIMAQSRVHR